MNTFIMLSILILLLAVALVLLVTFLVILTIWNVQIALPVAIVTGVLTFALRDLIKNLVASVFILANRPFQRCVFVHMPVCYAKEEHFRFYLITSSRREL